MAEVNEKQGEGAARSAGAKLQAFCESLTPEEQAALGAALEQLGVMPEERADDTRGNILPSILVQPFILQVFIRQVLESVQTPAQQPPAPTKR